MTAPNLFEQQDSNRRRSFWLVTGFVLFFAWVGFGGDIAWYLMTQPPPAGPEGALPGGHPSSHTVPFIGIIATLIAGGICWYSWKKGADRVLWATGAKEIFEPSNDLEQRLVNVVEEMAIAAGLPRPRIFVVPDPDPNAFATGIEPGKACVAVTEGLLQRLDRDELQGVVAHELAHVRNFDTRLMTLLAAMVGAIALMSDGMGRMLRFGNVGGRGLGEGGRGRGGKGGNPLAIVILVLWVITLILAPIISRFLAMAVSRKREYLADATGAQFTRNPLALAEALEKLDQAAEPTRAITRGAAHLCIVDPTASQLSAREGFLGDVFSSHPPIRLRIARLKGMGYQLAKQAGQLPAGG
jgi:heat shock protein HtpX